LGKKKKQRPLRRVVEGEVIGREAREYNCFIKKGKQQQGKKRDNFE